MKNNKKNHKLINKKILLWGLLGIFLLGAFVGSGTPGRKARAQESDNSWSTPVNLSHSGAASNPIMVIDSNNIVHVIWEDQFDGWVYTSVDGNQWSLPEAVSFPFANSIPRLFSDSQGFIHALWISDDNTLFYSRVVAKDFGQAGSWETQKALASSAVDFDLSEDSQGNLHLAYVRILDDGNFPAGIYYRRSQDSGANWTQATSIYTSAYFRSLTRDNANVRIASATDEDGTNIYTVWDNHPRRRVYLAQSKDGGVNWNSPVEIDQPASGSGSTPSNIRVNAEGKNAILIWQNGELATGCIQYYQWSQDAGVTWSERGRMPEYVSGCADNTFIFSKGAISFIQSNISSQVYLLAWDGQHWGEPLVQQELSSFEDPETLSTVILSCQHIGLTNDDRLVVVGCDIGGGGDIWFISRDLGNVAEWLLPSSVWNKPVLVASNLQNEFPSPVLVADNENQVHAFWIQPDDTEITSGSVTTIFYSRWDGEYWSRPFAALKSPNGNASQPTVTLDSKGRLLVVWSGGRAGDIFFSWADADRAENASEWVQPQILPSPQTAGSSPHILADDAGNLFVVYAIPYNEDRGIYLVHSSDGGKTWSTPNKIFDAVSAKWDQVDQPKISQTLNGLQVIWTRYSLSADSAPVGLYYARSEDGGKSWSKPEMVSAKAVIWNQIISDGGKIVHRLWQEETDGRTSLWHQYSTDEGITWSHPSNVSNFGDQLRQLTLSMDKAGRLHLEGEMTTISGKQQLRDWQWDEEGWVEEESIDIQTSPDDQLFALSSTISPDGHLALLYGIMKGGAKNNQSPIDLFFTNRPFDIPELPATIPTVSPLPISTLSPTPITIQETAASPTPTAISLTDQEKNIDKGSIVSGSRWVGPIIGLVGAGLIVLIVSIYAIFFSQWRRGA